MQIRVRDVDPVAPPAAPEEPTPETPLGSMRSILQRLLEDFVATNSRLPATKAFLEARGLTSVDQLTAEGKAELVIHLEDTLRTLYLAGQIT